MKSLSGRFVLVIVLLQLCLSVQEVSASGKPAGGAAGASASQNQEGTGAELVREALRQKFKQHESSAAA